MSYLDAAQSSRVSHAYLTLGLVPISTQYNSGARAFAKHRRKIAIQDEKLALSREEVVQDPRLNAEEPFPFMDLPAEIRVRIYQYALARPRRLHLEVMRTPALACVSKQIRQECLATFLRVNSFQASYTRGLDGTFGLTFADETLAWLKTLPFTTRMIQDIRVTFQGDLGQRGHRSVIFQIIATAKETWVNHFDRWCPFCIDGFYGSYYHLPHPNYDHPCLKTNPLKLKGMHDEFVAAVERTYFKDSDEWGRGGLSISEVIDLGGAADEIKQNPDVFIPFCFSIQKLIEHTDKIEKWAGVYSDYLASQRAQEALLEADGLAQEDPALQWTDD
ncbi:uncharacterized protein M437DRAFT_81067 [Aureobasidium melanogenum CBS 110374]|uniref:2EXR domain-containing protein n=1 Tax=Aureobasidium melanogenum (strain CBS 110374) TaxID=1043003 RepID=A0A074W4U3_AURM1|nr:uncharacterized protein M437DRAFT_81067 [Aureobasidium melanogenum CBS 110374]KEQ66574.1 hypothetical protein M437DRAFT_81067 [Aureobasidium melanogenum CBS 110374]